MSRSFKKVPYVKVCDSEYKKITKRVNRRKLKNNDVVDGNMYRKYTNRYSFINQKSYMSKEEFEVSKRNYEQGLKTYYNDFYSDNYNWYRAFKGK